MTTGNSNRRLALALVLVVGAACAKSPKAEPFSYEDRVAIAVAGSDKVCVSAKGGLFKPGDEVRLIDPVSQKSWPAVVEPAAEPCEPSVSDVPLRAVRVRVTGEQPAPFIGVAIQAPNNATNMKKPMKAVRLLRNSYHAFQMFELARVRRTMGRPVSMARSRLICRCW